MIEFLNSFLTEKFLFFFGLQLLFSILIFIAKNEFLNVLKAFFHYKILTPASASIPLVLATKQKHDSCESKENSKCKTSLQ